MKREVHLSATATKILYFEGDEKSVVEEHFSRCGYGDGAKESVVSEKGMPMRERKLPASFWECDQNHNMTTNAAAARYADFYGAADPLQAASGLTGALHRLAATCAATGDWNYSPQGASASGSVSIAQQSSPGTAAAGYATGSSSRTAHHATAASVYNYGPTAAYNWSRLTAAAAGHHAAHLKSEWPTSADYMAASLQQHSDLSHHYAAAHYNMTGLEGSVQDSAGKDIPYYGPMF